MEKKVYSIFAGNMERLEKKLTRIKNKCIRYGCDFHYEVVGEEWRDMTDGDCNTFKAKFIQIEAEGTAKLNGWKFIASVDHTANGNIINKAEDVEVPERYYNCKPYCEHCKSNRLRKNTFIVMNEESGEFKQVGKSCLADFTGGLSASAIAQYMSLFDELIEGETPDPNHRPEPYYDTMEVLAYIAETINHFGYVKSDEFNPDDTKSRSSRYFGLEHGWFWDNYVRKSIRSEMNKVGFDYHNGIELADAALQWVKKQEANNNYMHNLKTACESECVSAKHFGILASLFPCYDRNLEIQKRKEETEAKAKLSEYIGNIGDRIQVAIKEGRCLTSWETQFGTTYLYKFVTEDDDVIIWKTQKDLEEIQTLKGTVKKHDEYRGVKQTELTRCKVL